MKQNQKRNRRTFLLLVILFLVSLSYLALEFSTYFEGSWQIVQGHSVGQTNKSKEPFTVPVLERATVKKENWQIVREGQLFFKSLPVIEEVDLPEVINTLPATVEPPKPTCPLVVSGIMMGKEPIAILVTKTTQSSQTAKVGMTVGNFEIIQIERDFVLVKDSETEFKLELGGM